ncbi:hypothetical protein [Saccharomonospora glauca]|uniref:Uncharacterized protein n=1 Tax=Saccharomonospora glauca K62 TaxID=928724 RepID=I1D5B9_9PSEU|nr:hypothetical protein [Saccharomonospora glauca]EIF00144.1 hypothetical protein SacglDRAFT_03282 [Saccharomonospora glauca K62]
MVTPEEKRKALFSIIGNGLYLLVIAAAVVFLVVIAINSDGGYSLGLLLGRVALVLAVIYLLVRFVKWAARR